MSTHDRGAFGALLAEAKALTAKNPGPHHLVFDVDLDAPDDDETRWGVIDKVAWSGQVFHGQGRTGEEALRRLVEALRAR